MRSRFRRFVGGAAALAVLVGSAIGVSVVSRTPTAPEGVTAHIFVATTGTSSCVRNAALVSYSDAVAANNVCGPSASPSAFGKAYAISSSSDGDGVLIRGGTYAKQTITSRSGEQAPGVTFRPYPGETVTVAGFHDPALCCRGRLYGAALILGNQAQAGTPLPPSYITFKNINWNGVVLQAGNPTAGYRVFDGGHIWDVNNQQNPLFQIGGGPGNAIKNMEIGPGCCSGDYITLGVSFFTGVPATTTSGSPVLTAISSTSLMSVGDKVAGPGIPGNTTIVSKDSGTQVTLSANATASASTFIAFLITASRSIGFVIDSNYMHDLTVDCVGNPDAACDDTRHECSFGIEQNCEHPDAVQISDAESPKITNNKIFGVGCQAVFVATGNGDLQDFKGDWLIANNDINQMTQCNSNQKALSMGGICMTNGNALATKRACWTGSLKILHNTIHKSQGICFAGCQGSNIDENTNPGYFAIFGDAFTLDVVGNLLNGGGYGFGPNQAPENHCVLKKTSGSDLLPTFSKNRIGTGFTPCGSDTAGNASLVNTGIEMLNDGIPPSNQAAAGASTANVNLALASSPQSGITNTGNPAFCGPGTLVTRDVDGVTRTASCDLGAHEIP